MNHLHKIYGVNMRDLHKLSTNDISNFVNSINYEMVKKIDTSNSYYIVMECVDKKTHSKRFMLATDRSFVDCNDGSVNYSSKWQKFLSEHSKDAGLTR